MGRHLASTTKWSSTGPAAKLSGDLHHYTCPSLRDHLQKISYFGDIFLRRQLDRGTPAGPPLTPSSAPTGAFFAVMSSRLGFLDGFPGFYIACYMGFATFYRYTLLYEHLQNQRAPRPPPEDLPQTPPPS